MTDFSQPNIWTAGNTRRMLNDRFSLMRKIVLGATMLLIVLGLTHCGWETLQAEMLIQSKGAW